MSIGLSCSTIPFQSLPLGSALRRLRELGFTRADLPIFTFRDWCHITPEDVRKDPAMALGLIDTAVATSGVEIGMLLVSTNGDSNQERGDFEAVCNLAVRLGVKAITANPWMPDEWIERNRLKDFMHMTNERKLTLCVETHEIGCTVDPEAAYRLVSETPGLKLTMDVANLLSHGFPPVTWIPLFPYVGHCHIRDGGHTPDTRQLPWGAGEMDAAFVVSALKRVKYDGLISVDYIGPRAEDSVKFDPVPEIIKAKEALEKLIA